MAVIDVAAAYALNQCLNSSGSRMACPTSEDVVYVVREGSYTVDYKERETGTSYLVMTTIWHRQEDGWRMVR